MSLVAIPEITRRRAAPEIAVEASSQVAREPEYDELWARPVRAARLPQPAQRGRRRSSIGALAVVAVVLAAVGLRTSIVRAAPALSVVYEAVGLPVNLDGLALRGVRARIMRDGDRRVLVAEGEIVNIRREETRVPALALAVNGANGLRRYAWTVPGPKARLAPGEAVNFRARLAAPPENGADVVVRFAPPARVAAN